MYVCMYVCIYIYIYACACHIHTIYNVNAQRYEEHAICLHTFSNKWKEHPQKGDLWELLQVVTLKLIEGRRLRFLMEMM